MKQEKILKDLIWSGLCSGDEIKGIKDKQNPFLWIVSLFSPQEYTVSATTTYDKELLKGCIDNLEAFKSENLVEPVDAYIDYQDERYVMVDEVAGNILSRIKYIQLQKGQFKKGGTSFFTRE